MKTQITKNSDGLTVAIYKKEMALLVSNDVVIYRDRKDRFGNREWSVRLTNAQVIKKYRKMLKAFSK